MTALSGPFGALAIALIWLAAALCLGYVPLSYRARAGWVIALPGVPVLGWLTYLCGPGVGVIAFAIGLLALRWSPVLIGPRTVQDGGAKAHGS